MTKNNLDSKRLVDYKVNVKLKLASLWSVLMFLYIYADYFELMTPGTIEKIMNLESPLISTAITPGLLIGSSILLIIPALMIFLSAFLKARINKWLNIIIGFLYAIISILIIVSGIGNKWQTFFVLYNVIEVVIFSIIIWQAWKWPKTEKL